MKITMNQFRGLAILPRFEEGETIKENGKVFYNLLYMLERCGSVETSEIWVNLKFEKIGDFLHLTNLPELAPRIKYQLKKIK